MTELRAPPHSSVRANPLERLDDLILRPADGSAKSDNAEVCWSVQENETWHFLQNPAIIFVP